MKALCMAKGKGSEGGEQLERDREEPGRCIEPGRVGNGPAGRASFRHAAHIFHRSYRLVRYHVRMDELSGCDLDFREEPTSDDDIVGVVLFAGIDPEDAEAVEEKAEAWRRLGELD